MNLIVSRSGRQIISEIRRYITVRIGFPLTMLMTCILSLHPESDTYVKGINPDLRRYKKGTKKQDK
jgi:hypothetical protein